MEKAEEGTWYSYALLVHALETPHILSEPGQCPSLR